MSQKFEKLKTLLKELFQLDQPDLDFGLYRIMHAKSDEVTQFLDKDLLPQVRPAFGLYKTSDKAELEKELLKVIEQANALGADPETMPKVKDLRARIANEAVDIGVLENEVYDHLFSFLRRAVATIGVCQTSCPPISCGVFYFGDAGVAFRVQPDVSGGLPRRVAPHSHVQTSQGALAL